MDTINIVYEFVFPDGSHRVCGIRLNPQSIDQYTEEDVTLPGWTLLSYHQCPNCPLDSTATPHCPVAVNLVKLVKETSDLRSYDKVEVKITTPERTVSSVTTIQRGISSLLGLTMATSACPHTSYLKPMARFHLPFASEQETLCRATSMYLLAQYFLYKQGKSPDLELTGLNEVYRNLQIVNNSLAQRLRAASDQDAAVNAIILLDLFAKAFPYCIEESMEDVRYLFTAFIETQDSPIG